MVHIFLEQEIYFSAILLTYFDKLTGSLALIKRVSSRKPFLVLLEISVSANTVLGNRLNMNIFVTKIIQRGAHVDLIMC